jgi:uncharacterized SAM-binding protein YcdF (DUF218 family)
VLKKVITVMFLPLGFVILLLVFSAVFIREKLKLFIVIAALLVYVLSISPTADFLVGSLESAYSPPALASLETCDAYVVLGEALMTVPLTFPEQER